MRKSAALGLLSGALIALSFPPFGIWPLLFVALVPLIRAALRARAWREAFVAGAACSIATLLFGYYWIVYVCMEFGKLGAPFAVLVLVLLSLFAEAQLLLFALGLFGLKRLKTPILVAWIAPLYVAVEWFYPKIFPDTIGYPLHGWLNVAQVAELTGMAGLTFLVVWVNGSLAFLMTPKTHKIGARSLCAAIVLLAIAHTWGGARIQTLDAKLAASPRTFKVASIQGNIANLRKEESEDTKHSKSFDEIRRTYHDLSLKGVREREVDLVVWPETAYPSVFTATPSNAAWFKEFAGELRKPLLFGGFSMQDGFRFNSALLMDASGELMDVYRKTILIPFGEYIPLGPLSELVRSYVPAIKSFAPGEGEPKVLKFGEIKLGPQICYEAIIPSHSARSAAGGAEVIMNLTNDGWFGPTPEPMHHLMFTAMRAIEVRRPLLRSTNTGYTTFIDIAGRIHDKGPLFEQAVVYSDVKLMAKAEDWPSTLYAAHGEWLAALCAAFLALMLARVYIMYLIRS